MAENKFYTKWWFWVMIGVIILAVIGGIFSNSSRSTNQNNLENTDTQKIEENPVNIKPIKIEDLSTLILKVEDFPKDSGWTLKDRSERGKTDVSDRGLILGWKRGYMASYIRGDINLENLDYSRVDLSISEYPIENITFVIKIDESDNYTRYDQLSDPIIGDESKAYKVIEENDVGYEDTYYQIEFRKKNIMVTLMNYGTRTDYELLKDLAKKVESKI